MSNVPKLRFSEFSQEWSSYRFGDLVKLLRGSSPRPIVKFITQNPSGVNWIKIGDTKFATNFISQTKERITQAGAKKSRAVFAGDIILSNSMSYGKPYVLKIDGYIHDGWFVIRDFDKSFDKSYLLQLLGSEWIQKQYKRLAAGGVVDNISSELVNAVIVNLPTISEQQRISSVLSAVDTKIEQLTRKEELLKQYKKGVMQKIFSQEIRFKADDGSDFPEWEDKSIGQLGKVVTGKTPSTSDNDSWNGDLPFVTPTDITENKYQSKTERTVSREQGNKVIPRGSIMYTCIASIGKLSVAVDACITNQQINSLVVNPMHNNEFIYYGLCKITPKIKATQANTTLPIINKTEFSKFVLETPCKPEQIKIASWLSVLDIKLGQIGLQINAAKTFKKGLLQQMFV